MTIINRYQNGNANIEIFSNGTRCIEFDNNLNLDYPLNIDIRLMSKCSLGFNPRTGKAICEFCHESARIDGYECDYFELQDKLIGLPKGIELAIGGNSLTVGLVEFISWCKSQGYIVNLTVNQIHAQTPKVAEKLIQMLNEGEIRGLGLSYRKDVQFKIPEYLINHPNVVGHVIAGIDTVDDVLTTPFKKVLVLGYKIFGFGEQYYSEDVERNLKTWLWWVRKLFDTKQVVSFDNLALEQLNIRRFFPDKKWNEFNQGEHSFYINAVDKTFSPSSRSSENVLWSNLSVKEYFSNLN